MIFCICPTARSYEIPEVLSGQKEARIDYYSVPSTARLHLLTCSLVAMNMGPVCLQSIPQTYPPALCPQLKIDPINALLFE